MREYGHGGDIYGQKNILDFSASLNPLGMPEEIKEAVRESAENCSPYPDPHMRRLKAVASDRMGVSQENLVFGNGASDLIFRICLALRPKVAVIEEPAFSEYQKGLELVGCHILHHSQPKENEFRTDAESLMGFIAATRPDMVFLGLPSNPTGTMIEKEDLIRICDCAEDAGAVVVIDRSFVHFVENKSKYFFKSEALSRKNVILLDSMTKIFAMAGLRLGYMITGNDEIVSKVENCLQPWPVSSPAEAAGIAAFEVGPGFFEETKRYVAEERAHLESGLRMLGMEVFESKANYVFFRSPRDLEGLKEKGILLRNCGNYWSLDDSYYRAAVRTHEENERLLFELYELLKEEAHG